MFEMKHLCNSLKHLSYSLLFHILNYKPILKWPWDDPPPHIYFMPLSAPCEGIPVTFHDNVRHDLSNNTKWTREMCVCVTSKQQQAAFKPSFYDIFMSESKPTLNKLDGQKSNLCQKRCLHNIFLRCTYRNQNFKIWRVFI